MKGVALGRRGGVKTRGYWLDVIIGQRQSVTDWSDVSVVGRFLHR